MVKSPLFLLSLFLFYFTLAISILFNKDVFGTINTSVGLKVPSGLYCKRKKVILHISYQNTLCALSLPSFHCYCYHLLIHGKHFCSVALKGSQ